MNNKVKTFIIDASGIIFLSGIFLSITWIIIFPYYLQRKHSNVDDIIGIGMWWFIIINLISGIVFYLTITNKSMWDAWVRVKYPDNV